MPQDAHDWMTIQEVADHYRRPVKTLYDWRYRGFGPKAVRVGARLLYKRETVLEWLERQESVGAS